MSDVEKRPDAWRSHCPRCGARGEWRDRKWWAAQDLVAHDMDQHGGRSSTEPLHAVEP